MNIKSLWTTLASTGAVSVALAASGSFNGALTEADALASAAQVSIGDTTGEGIAATIDIQATRPTLSAEAGVRVIVIDAGHGGRDLGCRGGVHGVKEKVIALELALGLRDLIRRNHPDVEVVLTRDRDVFVPLHERARMANRARADLFLSLHCNALPTAPRVRGSESYVMGLHTAQHNLDVAKRENAAIHHEGHSQHVHYDFDPETPTGHITLSMFQHAFLEQSMALAGELEAALGSRDGHKSRGVKQAGFLVLKETAMPSVLVETGYLTNPDEETYLRDASGQAETTKALYQGLLTYMEERRRVALESSISQLAPAAETAPRPALTALPTPRLEPVPGEQPSPDQQRLASITEPDRPIEAHVAVPNARKVNERPGWRSTFTVIDSVGTASGVFPVVESEPPSDISVTAAGSSVVSYYVQLAASAKTLDVTSGTWVDLGHPLRSVEEEGLYKYQLGPFNTKSEADIVRRAARKGNFPDAFTTGYANGAKLSQSQL